MTGGLLKVDDVTNRPNGIRFAVASPKPSAQVFPMLRFCLFLCLSVASAQAETKLRIAAAANLVHVIEVLAVEFQNAHPGVTTEVTLGASGSLVAQIAHGAPYDVFLSADMNYPQALIANGHADVSSLTPFATGRLVLWTTNDKIPLTVPESSLSDPSVYRIAMANPDTAPYGRAALEVLKELNLLSKLRPKLVIGENISQATQFVASGNADLGFVALSLVLSPQLKNSGQWIEIPSTWHKPLLQGAVITQQGTKNPLARNFLLFLQGPTAGKIFARFGYLVPAQL